LFLSLFRKLERKLAPTFFQYALRNAVLKFRTRADFTERLLHYRSVDEVAAELGTSNGTLYRWAKEYGTSQEMKKSDRRPQDWSAAEKLKAVIEFEGLSADKRGEFLRREGLHTEHIEAWKKAMQSGLDAKASTQASRTEMSELKARNKELERDIRRKDKALAETTALLVLKKKADLIWGTGENE
jgi:transposase